MRASKLCFCFAIACLFNVQVFSPSHSYADTYNIFNLGSDQGYFFYAMDNLGHVIIDNPTGSVAAPCNLSSTCYNSYLNGLFSGRSLTAPSIIADNGTPCTPAVPAGGSVVNGVCNNGRDAFTGFLSAGQAFANVYTGATTPTLLALGGGGNIFMNSLGDIVFDDTHYTEDWFLAVDVTTRLTPEPNSLLLLATGTLAAVFTLRRRIRA